VTGPDDATREQVRVEPTVSTAPPPGRPHRWWSAIPSHLGRARTSTVVLGLLFLAVGALYLTVRPEPVATATTGGGTGVTTPAPTTAGPIPETTPAGTTPAPTTEVEPTTTEGSTSPTTPPTTSPTDGTTPEETTRSAPPPTTGTTPPVPTTVTPTG
jgi:hypothetical protein